MSDSESLDKFWASRMPAPCNYCTENGYSCSWASAGNPGCTIKKGIIKGKNEKFYIHLKYGIGPFSTIKDANTMANELKITCNKLEKEMYKHEVRGQHDCYQDHCENCPFSSVGGLENRDNLKAPDYIKPDEINEYITGYSEMAQELYGDDWRTCKFSWKHVMTINTEE